MQQFGPISILCILVTVVGTSSSALPNFLLSVGLAVGRKVRHLALGELDEKVEVDGVVPLEKGLLPTKMNSSEKLFRHTLTLLTRWHGFTSLHSSLHRHCKVKLPLQISESPFKSLRLGFARLDLFVQGLVLLSALLVDRKSVV